MFKVADFCISCGSYKMYNLRFYNIFILITFVKKKRENIEEFSMYVCISATSQKFDWIM